MRLSGSILHPAFTGLTKITRDFATPAFPFAGAEPGSHFPSCAAGVLADTGRQGQGRAQRWGLCLSLCQSPVLSTLVFYFHEASIAA